MMQDAEYDLRYIPPLRGIPLSGKYLFLKSSLQPGPSEPAAAPQRDKARQARQAPDVLLSAICLIWFVMASYS